MAEVPADWLEWVAVLVCQRRVQEIETELSQIDVLLVPAFILLPVSVVPVGFEVGVHLCSQSEVPSAYLEDVDDHLEEDEHASRHQESLLF